MKNTVLSLLAIFVTSLVNAKTVPTTTETVDVSSVDQVIRLVDKRDSGSSQLKVSILVTDQGMSTDVSPRHTVYLAFASLAEMGNLFATVKITNEAFEFVSAKRVSAGIYEVVTKNYLDAEGMLQVTYTIDATKLFSDERKTRKACDSGFCDQELSSSVEVMVKSKVLE